MKVLLGAALILIVLYLISGTAITSVVQLGEKGAVGVGGRQLSMSPFKVTFRDQYLCYSYADGRLVTSDRDTGDGCKGPFFDSVSLCSALAEEGQTSVRLFWEGRVLECG